MDMKTLINRSYEAIKNRGLINEHTTEKDFFDKIEEEFNELKNAYSEENEIEEATDLATTCFMFLKFKGLDPIKEFEKVIIKNENRANDYQSRIN